MKAIIDFSAHNYSDVELSVKARTIAKGIRNTPELSALEEQATEIENQDNVYARLLSQTVAGDRLTTAEKKAARKTLEKLLKSTGLKVQDISGGNEVIILSSGYDVPKKRTPVGLLPQPEYVQVKQGYTTGSLDVSWKKVPGAYCYEIRYTIAPKTPDSLYSSITSTKHKATIDNLIPGQRYIIQVAGAGTFPQKVWSVEVVSIYVS